MEDIVEKSGTGGIEQVFGPEDENAVPNSEMNQAEETPTKKKQNGNTGQLDSKMDEEETEVHTDDVKRSSISQKGNFNTIGVSLNQTMVDSEISRFDRNGNPITTVIGKFATGAMRKSMKSSNRKSLQTNMNSDTGAADLASPEKKDVKQRHKVTFMDEVSGDKGQLVEIHLIESYKKFNQDSYLEN